MPRRISWKKGMRLTDEVLQAADACTSEYIGKVLLLAAGGRFGLLPSARPFKVQLSIAKGFVDVEALDCLAVTPGGHLIDIHYDTKFTNTFDSRIQIPDEADTKEYFLTVSINPDVWRDTTDGYQEQEYSFSLIGNKTALQPTAIPISRIVNEDGWREDSTHFVPPCLLVASHPRFEELHSQFLGLLRNIDTSTREQLSTGARTAISIYWPVVQRALITASTEHDIMTPQQLLACVQQMVGAFAMACEFDEALNLEDANTFLNYAQVPYNYRIAYLRIKQGLGMCYAINEKIGKFSLLKVEPKPEPIQEPIPEPEPVKPDPRRTWGGKRI